MRQLIINQINTAIVKTNLEDSIPIDDFISDAYIYFEDQDYIRLDEPNEVIPNTIEILKEGKLHGVYKLKEEFDVSSFANSGARIWGKVI
ncbi:MAG: hypothetical protein BWY74_01101 [Firmicutes bacterium ADurb.Bin419]|jgi:hypothetical protein|nr:hypothetical protein [Bacteroidales bacterium]OPZ93486.1 MAG: hypothetical protein BWY74_01101 [Firmicutes bacterium ADurb.Bin419]HKM12049.1 hypothetical protein [Bacteroidales bacterium]HPY22026.1 hypothetical protein [Bacteroidales bacterium]HQA93011.1 hypothetical protein [Bacteroidales bacterium]